MCHAAACQKTSPLPRAQPGSQLPEQPELLLVGTGVSGTDPPAFGTGPTLDPKGVKPVKRLGVNN